MFSKPGSCSELFSHHQLHLDGCNCLLKNSVMPTDSLQLSPSHLTSRAIFLKMWFVVSFLLDHHLIPLQSQNEGHRVFHNLAPIFLLNYPSTPHLDIFGIPAAVNTISRIYHTTSTRTFLHMLFPLLEMSVFTLLYTHTLTLTHMPSDTIFFFTW